MKSDPPPDVVELAVELASTTRAAEAQQRRFAEETQATADQHRHDADAFAAEADAIEAWLDSVAPKWRATDDAKPGKPKA